MIRIKMSFALLSTILLATAVGLETDNIIAAIVVWMILVANFLCMFGLLRVRQDIAELKALLTAKNGEKPKAP